MQEHSRIPSLVERAAESAADQVAAVAPGPADPKKLAALEKAIRKARESAGKAKLDKPFMPRDRASALIQAAMDQRVREALAAGDPAAGVLEATGNQFLFSNADPLWSSVLAALIGKWLTPDAKFISRPELTTPIRIGNQTSIALFSDWGTGRPPAISVAEEITRRDVEYMIHLGDIYYAGLDIEVVERFLDRMPKSTRLKRRFALNGNHEMYSGGHAYFGKVLSTFNQQASYFCLENDHWRLIGLDTAHKDQDLRDPQLAWLTALVSANDGRKNIVLSHHQLFSCFENVNDRILKKVGPLLDAGKIHAWFWGHEHKHIVYKKHRGLLARCIGHGAIPDSPPPTTFRHPGFAVQFVNRRMRPDSVQGINGFAVMKLNGPKLDVEYVDEDGFVPFGENLDIEIGP